MYSRDHSLSPQSETLIRNYRPRMPAQYWASIETFVRTTVLAASPDTYEQTRRLLTFVAQFALWAWGTACLELNTVEILVPSVIDAYLQMSERDIAPSARERERNALHWLCKRLNPTTAKSAKSYAPKPSRPEMPYNERELGQLQNWASAQRLTRTRRNLRTMLALGAGAGLHPNEIINLRTVNIELSAQGTTVHVSGKNARSVPLLETWEDYLQTGTEDGYAISSNASARSTRILIEFIAASSGVQIKATPQRLRATWLVAHLNAATPLPLLLDAAGLASPFSLDRYLPYVRPTPATEASLMLRQPSGTHA